MAANLITITEQWIRDKLQLQHVCLADVRSLYLPGTYEMGKICHLGFSLKNFVRLKSLDLSHNALDSVQGIVHLKLLEKLNLYYNRISSLEEVLILRKLENLKELDLRLNPVVQKHPHYRLCLIHSLVQLRNLDACAVRDRERKAALMYFSLEEEPEITPTSQIFTEKRNRSSKDRIASVNRMMSKLLLRDGNEETVLRHNLNEDRNIKRREACSVILNKDMTKIQSKCSPEISPAHNAQHRSSLKPHEAPRVTFAEPHVEKCSPTHLLQIEEQKLRGSRTFAESTFTPHPHHQSPAAKEDQQECLQKGERIIKPNPQNPAEGEPARASPELKKIARFHKGSYKKPLELLLSLVEEYWAGKNGQNTKHFFMQAVRILCMMEQEMERGETQIKSLKTSVQTLKTQAKLQEKQHQAENRRLAEQLQQANDSIERLYEELHRVLEENVALEKKLIELQQSLLPAHLRIEDATK